MSEYTCYRIQQSNFLLAWIRRIAALLIVSYFATSDRTDPDGSDTKQVSHGVAGLWCASRRSGVAASRSRAIQKRPLLVGIVMISVLLSMLNVVAYSVVRSTDGLLGSVQFF